MERPLFSYKGFDIPVDLVNLTGGGPDSFDFVSRHHMTALDTTIGIAPGMSILEIGCGIGRDAIPLADLIGSSGSYLGIDIIGRSIAWCADNIGRRHPNFRFVHFDVKDQLHNPDGTSSMDGKTIPLPDGSVDRIILWSVFTHMFGPDILHYLREFRRVLKRDGLIMASLFCVDDAVIAAVQRKTDEPYGLRFEHRQGNGCFINDPVHPAGAVAYTQEAFEALVREAGLVPRRLVRGSWSGHHATEWYQDMSVIGQPGLVRRLARAARLPERASPNTTS